LIPTFDVKNNKNNYVIG